MADHGNDPTIGHSHHTREVVPVLVYQQGMIATQLGVRTTLSDVGATVCEFFRAPPPQNGRSFLFLPPVCRRHPMSFDPTGYTLAHEHLHIDLSGFKNNVDCRLDQYAFICRDERPDDPGRA